MQTIEKNGLYKQYYRLQITVMQNKNQLGLKQTRVNLSERRLALCDQRKANDTAIKFSHLQLFVGGCQCLPDHMKARSGWRLKQRTSDQPPHKTIEQQMQSTTTTPSSLFLEMRTKRTRERAHTHTRTYLVYHLGRFSGWTRRVTLVCCRHILYLQFSCVCELPTRTFFCTTAQKLFNFH